MTDTTHLNLPLLSPSQAQKHVTVNEALMRLDGLVQLRLRARGVVTPPVVMLDGDAYLLGSGAVNTWAGQDGDIAVAVSGGWTFVTPTQGWQAWVADEALEIRFDGNNWIDQGVSLTPGGAGMALQSIEIDVSLAAGAVQTTATVFPARSLVFGVTGRVLQGVSGTATSWKLGDTGDDARFGDGLGLGQNSWVSGPTTPFVYWSAEPLVISANGGDFVDGQLRLAVHFAQLALPNAI
jgi:hypothetical protein